MRKSNSIIKIEKKCECGCGREFNPRSPTQQFATRGCSSRYMLTNKHADDPEILEAMRQFQVICKVVFQLRGPGSIIGGLQTRAQINLHELGKTEFQLSERDTRLCINRARSFLDEVNRLDRLRQAAAA